VVLYFSCVFCQVPSERTASLLAASGSVKKSAMFWPSVDLEFVSSTHEFMDMIDSLCDPCQRVRDKTVQPDVLRQMPQKKKPTGLAQKGLLRGSTATIARSQ
jgi:hypothetical protein